MEMHLICNIHHKNILKDIFQKVTWPFLYLYQTIHTTFSPALFLPRQLLGLKISPERPTISSTRTLSVNFSISTVHFSTPQITISHCLLFASHNLDKKNSLSHSSCRKLHTLPLSPHLTSGVAPDRR